VGDTVTVGQVPSGDPNAVAVHSVGTGAHQQGPSFAHHPGAEPTRLEYQPGRGMQAAVLVVDEICEQQHCA
jgi:hypothetical protein